MISKKNLLKLSAAVAIIFFTSGFATRIGICPPVTHSQCSSFFDTLATMLLPIFVLLVLCITTYKMRDQVYQSWFRFVRWWIPLSVFLVLLAPKYSTDWMFPYEKVTVAFFSSLTFLILSLALIIWKYTKHTDTGRF